MFKTCMPLVAGLVQPISETHSSMQINPFQDGCPCPRFVSWTPCWAGSQHLQWQAVHGCGRQSDSAEGIQVPPPAAHSLLWLIAVYATFRSNRRLWNCLLFWKLTTKCIVSFDVISAIVVSLLLLSMVIWMSSWVLARTSSLLPWPLRRGCLYEIQCETGKKKGIEVGTYSIPQMPFCSPG